MIWYALVFIAGTVCGGAVTMLILSLGYTAGGKQTPDQDRYGGTD